MRRAGPLLIILVLLAIPAAAQEPARPTLTLDPAVRDAPPGGNATFVAFLGNPSPHDITWQLSAQARPAAKVEFRPAEITVAAQSRERVEFRVFVNDTPNARYNISLEARETAASARAAGRDAPITLHARAEVRVGPGRPPPPATDLASAAPAAQLRVLPDPIVIEEGAQTRARLVVRNLGPDITDVRLDVRAPEGTHIVAVDPPARIASGAEAIIELRIGTTATAGATQDATVRLVGVRAPAAALHLNIVEPMSSIPPATSGEAAPRTADDNRLLAAASLAAAGGLWTSLWLTRRKWWPLLAALYTRLKPSRLLDHPVRARIVETVRTEPGVHFNDLARRVEIAPGQLTHHARMLEKASILFSSPDGQTRRFFLVDEGRVAAVAPLPERILTLVRERPRAASDVARELGVSRQSMHYHLKRLVAEGQLLARVDGRETWLESPHAVTPPASRARS